MGISKDLGFIELGDSTIRVDAIVALMPGRVWSDDECEYIPSPGTGIRLLGDVTIQVPLSQADVMTALYAWQFGTTPPAVETSDEDLELEPEDDDDEISF